jgi:stage IV sporulation protein FB
MPGFSVAGVRVRLHAGLLALLALGVLAHLGPEVAVFAAVLLGHELAHILMAAAFGLRVSAVDILPTGGVAAVEGLESADPGVEAVVALAGPLHNLLCLAAGVLLRSVGALAPGRGEFFLMANAALAVGNLLPALPLDGGRVTRAALSLHRGLHAAQAWVARAGLVVGGALLLGGLALLVLGTAAPGLFIFGGFTFFGARRAGEGIGVRPWREMARRAEEPTVLPVHHLACPPSEPLVDLVRRFRPHHYHLVWVVAPGRGATGPWDEAAVWRAVSARGAGARAADLRRDV